MSPDGMSPEPKRARRQSKDALEFYETPAFVTRAIMPHLPRASVVLDPCAGRGAILAAFADQPIEPHSLAIEIDERHVAQLRNWADEVVVADAFSTACDPIWARADAVVANPPFSLAQAFLEHAFVKCAPNATIAMLLRLSFLESKERSQLHREHPSDVFVFSSRPSFTGDGKSDSAAYMWAVFGPGRGGRWSVLDDVDPTKKVRKGRVS